MIVRLTERATIQNNQNVRYLLNDWSIKVATNYLDKFDVMINTLESGQILGRFNEDVGMYKYVLVKQISVFYIIKNKEEIEIRMVWNNYKKPFWL